MIYGFAASVLPVWMLLAPRDYLSTFMKLGTVAVLGVFIVIARAAAAHAGRHAVRRWQRLRGARAGVSLRLHHHRLRRGQRIPRADFLRHHAEVAGPREGHPPRRLRRDGHGNAGRADGHHRRLRAAARRIFRHQLARSIRTTRSPSTAQIAKINSYGPVYRVTEAEMQQLATDLGEPHMIGKAGGAPTFAVGMAAMFAKVIPGKTALSLWYHFAIMFEALFILTTLDAGTRVGRFILQDLLGNIWPPARQHRNLARQHHRHRPARRRLGILPLSGRASIPRASPRACGRSSASPTNCSP